MSAGATGSSPALLIAAGVLVAAAFHGALAAGYVAYSDGRVSVAEASLQSERSLQRQRLDFCGDRRCGRVEGRGRRRPPEEPRVVVPDILEAMVVPALGGVEPDPRQLPRLEAYEEAERVEEAINLENPDPKLEKLLKSDRPQEAKLDPLRRDSALDALLDTRNDDPRVDRKDIARITGFKDGEVGGQGLELKRGNIYSRKVARELSRFFTVPPFLDDASLKKLQVRVRVTRMSFDGAILAYQVVSRSGDRTFDDAAIATIKRFSTLDGGSQRLPAPDAEVLRFINARGLTVTLDGRLMRR